jgi:hypothetical protein
MNNFTICLPFTAQSSDITNPDITCGTILAYPENCITFDS